MAFELRSARALGLSVRPVLPGDSAFIASLYAALRAPEFSALGWPEAMLRQFLEQQEQAQRHHYSAAFPGADWLIVERQGRSVGRFYIQLSSLAFRLIDISLMPDEQRKGIGSALIRDLLDYAAESGRPVDLQVARLNPARALYERLGFVASCDGSGHYQMRCAPLLDPESGIAPPN
jgi:ribosomal protein S18 acetylase RimI-like enzyme